VVVAPRLMNFFSIVRAADAGVRIPFSSTRFQTSKHAPSVTSLVASLAPGISDVVFFQFLADPEASLVTNLVREETRRSREATLTYDPVFHWLTWNRSASPILPTAPAPDPRLSHAELSPSKFVSP
jgi:hypothetical protein